MKQKNILDWNDVEEAAKEAFTIWMDSKELEFAREAWQLIINQGLAEYSNEFERLDVVFRFLVIAEIHHEFSNLAFDENIECQFEDWAEILNVDKFNVGRIYQKLVGEEDGLESSYENALCYILSDFRKEVYHALISGYGSTSSLFLALYKSNWPDDYDENDVESDYEILNDVTLEKASAFSWIQEGCPKY